MPRAHQGVTITSKNLPAPVEVAVRVIPGASKNEIARQDDGAWKVRLTTPPIDGRANLALTEFVADKLKVNRSQVTLLRGKTSRHKTLAIYGLNAAEISEKLTEK